MVFSSLQFILIFMPIFFTVYYLTPGKYRNAVLLAGSLAFYLVGTINTPVHFILFVASIVADFLAGICMEKQQKYKKAILSCTIIFHLLCLCIFKYANFVLGELGKICDGFPSFNEIILPIGVSFYTAAVTGEKFYPWHVAHQFHDPPPCFIRLCAVRLNR